jgi:hypothetical protein
MARKLLRRLRILEGSLVDRPANPGARVLLFKRDDVLLGSEMAKGDVFMAQLDEETKQLFEELQSQLGDLTASNDKLTKARVEAEEEAEKLRKDLDALRKAKPGVILSADDEDDPILKGLSPVARQRFQDLQKQVDEQGERLRRQEEAREIAEATKYLGKRYPSLPFKAENLAPIWVKIAKALQPDELMSLERIFASHGTFAQLADREMGHVGLSGGDAGADAWAAIVAKARDLRKIDPKLTEEQAIDKVMVMEPKLYEQYRKEAQ